MSDNARRCSARRNDGRPCRAWAKRESEPALCASHLKAKGQEAEAADFYERGYDLAEIADLLIKNGEKDLQDELRVTRVAIRRALEQLRQELDPAEYARLIALIFKGAHTIADILRAQRALSGGKQELSSPVIDEAIESVLREKRVEGKDEG